MNPIQLYTQNNVVVPHPVELCSICLDNLNNTQLHTHTLAECNHVFHSNCLIGWLRLNDGCPLCRGTANRNNYHYRSNGVIFRHILSFCRSKKNKCKKLKRLYKNYEKYRDLYKINKANLIKFRKENKNVLNELSKLRNAIWKSRSKFNSIKREISNIPIQPVNR